MAPDDEKRRRKAASRRGTRAGGGGGPMAAPEAPPKAPGPAREAPSEAPREAPADGLTEATRQAVRPALDPLKDALGRLAEVPVVGPGVTRVMDLLASLGRDDVSSIAESRRAYDSEAEARAAFARHAAELLAPNAWSAVSGIENAGFAHHDAAGEAVAGRRAAKVGDFVRITLPFAGAERNEWVRVEHVIEQPDRVSVVVRPSHDPTLRPLRPDVVAHFFGPEATNAFTLVRDGATLVAQIAGRHERANVGPEAGGAANALRHRITAEAGWGVRRPDLPPDTAVDGPQQHQWNRFTANLLGLGFVP